MKETDKSDESKKEMTQAEVNKVMKNTRDEATINKAMDNLNSAVNKAEHEDNVNDKLNQITVVLKDGGMDSQMVQRSLVRIRTIVWGW